MSDTCTSSARRTRGISNGRARCGSLATEEATEEANDSRRATADHCTTTNEAKPFFLLLEGQGACALGIEERMEACIAWGEVKKIISLDRRQREGEWTRRHEKEMGMQGQWQTMPVAVVLYCLRFGKNSCCTIYKTP